MALRIWLPLKGCTKNLGLSEAHYGLYNGYAYFYFDSLSFAPPYTACTRTNNEFIKDTYLTYYSLDSLPEGDISLIQVFDTDKTTLYVNGIKTKELNIVSEGVTHDYYWAYNDEEYDVRIYDNALSPLEIYEIAKGLIIHYKFENNINNKAYLSDSSGYGNNGHPNGSAARDAMTFKQEDSLLRYTGEMRFEKGE